MKAVLKYLVDIFVKSNTNHEGSAEISGTYLSYSPVQPVKGVLKDLVHIFVSLAWIMKGVLKYMVHIFVTVWH